MPRDDYQQRREARIERLQERANKTSQNAEETLGEASRMASVIPMGQPILVGHHSERRDRNYRKRMDNKMRKGVELSSQAKELARRADAAENNYAVSSDDPEAVRKLKDKLTGLEANQEKMKALNAAWRKQKKPLPDDLGSWQKIADSLDLNIELLATIRLEMAKQIGWHSHATPYPAYALKNNNAEIRRVKQRIESLNQAASIETTEVDHGVCRVVENAELNRIQLIFDGKPSAEVRVLLKRTYGFRWARSERAWQRHLNNGGRAAAQAVVTQLLTLESEGGAV